MPTHAPKRKRPAPTGPRTKHLIVLLHPEEHAAIRTTATARGLSMNAYIRSLALADARRAA